METTGKNSKNWFALYVNVRHEKKIALKLQEKGIECYLPVIKRMRNWSDRKKLVEMPLLPGYIFVCLGTDELDKPRFVAGVVNYVRFNGKPAVIRSSEIEGLRYFVANGFSIEESGDADLKVGDKVKFVLSEFKMYTAIVEELSGEDFAYVTFEGVSRNFIIKAPVKYLNRTSA